MSLTVGCELWYVPNSRHGGGQGKVAVVKVGRKWAALDNGERIDKDEWYVDGKGYSSPGACYASQADYEEQTEIGQAWIKFCRDFNYSKPAGLTLERLAQIRSLLGME